jgi:uncharacterized protein (TIGR03545 family)
MFRKKGLIYTGVAAVLLVIFDVFFLNMAVKLAVVEAGKRAFMAKVDVKGVSVDVFKSKITIKGLTVADRNREFKNLFETSEITADFMFLPLLEKKVVIDNISVIDLALATDRTVSGFLPAGETAKIAKEKKNSENSFASKLLGQAGDKAKAEINKMPVSKLADLKDIKKMDYKKYINKENLKTYKAAKDAQEKIAAAKTQAENSIKAVDAGTKIKAAQDSLKKIRETKISGIQDAQKGQQALADLDTLKKSTDGLVKSAGKAKDDSQALADVSKQAMEAVKDAKEQDVRDIMSKMDVNILDAGAVEKAIIGPVWYGNVSKLLQSVEMANKYIPVTKKKKDTAAIEERGAGREVVFISGARYPTFWIKKVLFSTTGGGSAKYYMKGEMDDIALEQAVIGKPLTFSLSLVNPSETIMITGKIDHIDGRDDSISAAVSGLPAAASGLDKVDFGGISIKSAKTGYKMDVKSTDDGITLAGNIGEKEVDFSGEDAGNLTYQVLKGVDSFNINIAMKGTAGSSGMSVTSDIGDKLKRAIDKIYGKKVTEAKEAVRKAVEDSAKDELKSAANYSDSANSGVSKELKGVTDRVSVVQSDIDKTKNDIVKKMAGGGKNSLLKGLFK